MSFPATPAQWMPCCPRRTEFTSISTRPERMVSYAATNNLRPAPAQPCLAPAQPRPASAPLTSLNPAKPNLTWNDLLHSRSVPPDAQTPRSLVKRLGLAWCLPWPTTTQGLSAAWKEQMRHNTPTQDIFTQHPNRLTTTKISSSAGSGGISHVRWIYITNDSLKE